MKTIPVKTKVVLPGDDLDLVITNALSSISEKSVLAVTSKIVSLCEGSVVDSKEELYQVIAKNADQYIPANESKYGVMLTVKNGLLAVNAGVDQSNVKNLYALLPKDPYQSATHIWKLIKSKFGLKQFGVVITDSTSMPLKWGTVGRSLAHCGFKDVKSLIGQPDLFGKPLKMTKMNIAEGLASAAVLEMGEGAASTPLCLLEDISHIRFQDRPPTKKEILASKIALEEDVYSPLLKSPLWRD